jgi:perosamine synthetase
MVPEKNKKVKGYIPHNLPVIFDEEITEVKNLLSKSELTLGNKVREFEEVFKRYTSLPSVAVNSGTSALHLALEVLKIKENSKVLIPSYTCITVALPILYQRATPILADVQLDYNISIDEIKLLTNDIQAVIVPHMFGQPADIITIKEYCEEKEIYLIEDCAQSLGAKYEDKKVGTFGDISIFSFYATKMITSIQGGMICSRNKEWIEEIRRLIEPEGDPEDDSIRYRYTMSDVNAAVGITQLKKIDKFIKKRRKIAAIYREELEEVNLLLPAEKPKRKHVYHRFIVRTNLRPDKIIGRLYKKGIEAKRMHYPPLHRRKLLKKYGILSKYPITDKLAETSISLPIHPSLSDEEVLYIAASLKEILKEL